MNEKNLLINISQLTKKYNVNNKNFSVINKLSIILENNCIVSVTGPSGSGKSTLLNIIGLLDIDYQGQYEFNGKDIIFSKNKLLNSSKPIKLSGGEQQRVAIARSLINDPDLILADEMTGNLDENTAKEIFSFFISYVKENNKSLIYVTHNEQFSKQANSIYKFSNSSLVKIK